MLPLEFDPPAWDVADHITTKKVKKGTYEVTWPAAGLTLYSARAAQPEQHHILRHSTDVTFHGMSGYSVGTYHEFFVGAVHVPASFRMRKAEVTVGEVTPLAVYLYEAYYHRKAHGDEWHYLSTFRLQNVPLERAEAYFLNAMHVYGDHYGELPLVQPFGPIESWESTEVKPLPSKLARNAVAMDVEPLRFLYHGLRETEPESACLHFYRILEFYAFFEIQQDVAALRADTTLSDRRFLNKVAELVFRNERTPIVRLVTKLAGKRLLAQAVRHGLIAQPQGEMLGDALYDFRNSFVHAKYDQRTSIFSASVLDEDPTVIAWRSVFEQLGRKAIAMLSDRHR